MNWGAVNFDWNHLRAFLATAEEGSLSAAARALETTQPTLSRQVTALEEELGVTLFERGTRSMSLTTAGEELLEHARAMGEVALRASLSATGQSSEIAGHVVIAATEMLAAFHLPRAIGRILEDAPALSIEIAASNEIQDIIRREADIAIRHARPAQTELVARLLGETTAHIYASRRYLETHPMPETQEMLSRCRFTGIDPVERFMPDMSGFEISLDPAQFTVTTRSGPARMGLVREGVALSIIPKLTADRFDDLVPVMPEAFAIPVPVWLVTHRELKTSPRIRHVFDRLAEIILDELKA